MKNNQCWLKIYCTLAIFLASSLMADAANYLCFTAEEAGSEIRCDFGHSYFSEYEYEYGYEQGYEFDEQVDIQYSRDGGTTWTVVKNSEPIVLENIGDKVYFKGTNPYGLAGTSSWSNPVNLLKFMMSGRIAASGSVMSLIDGEGTSTRIDNEYCFYGLFMDCAALTTAPELPATFLSNGCYHSMFSGCTGLTEAPELPAALMEEDCYHSMFSGCTGLTKTPELSATQLANGCYRAMFNRCTGLVEATDLPATHLAGNCYDYMFEGCTSLTKAPELPAKQMEVGCYSFMFRGCTSLVDAPKLPATQLANYCYSYMFEGCKNLTAAPELPATQLKAGCYVNMFKGCNSLVKTQGMAAKEMATSCCRSMFEDCWNLVEAPDLLASKMDSFCCQSMFKNCSSLEKAPKLPAMELACSCYEEMFMYCSRLTEAPELPAVELASYCYSFMFKGCVYLTKAPILPSSELVDHCYYYMLNSCSRLNYIRVGVMSLENPFEATTEWVDGVDGNKGLFVFPCGSTYNVRGASDVPMNFRYVSSPLVIFQNPDSTELWRDTIGCGETPEYRGETPTYGEGFVFKRWDKKFIAHLDPDIYYYTAVYEEVEKPAPGDWLCFTAKEDSSKIWYEDNNGDKPDLWYSVNEGQDWIPLDSGQVVHLPHVGDRVFLKGNNPDGLTKERVYLTKSSHFGMSGRISASGSVMSLIDGTGESLTIPSDYCFRYLFLKCASLVKAPNLPATTLTDYCYDGMFQDCSNLTEIPELPATSLKEGCYSSMFRSCSNLTYVEELPATTLAPSCYSFMFASCSNLTDAPELPALKMEPSCYSSMFSLCRRMTLAPQLPATELAENCYSSMFLSTGLTQAPALPVTEMKEGCYSLMFQSCNGLTHAPELPAMDLAELCYGGMFYGCENLSEAPALPATTLANRCYESMFGKCTSLVRAPELPASDLVENCYFSMFDGCSKLNYIKVGVSSLDNDFNATSDWVKDVDSLGIFIFPCGSTYDKHGDSEVPTNFDIAGSPIIVFQNPDDTELWRDTVACGAMPEYMGETPTYGERLIFDGWDKELTAHEEPGFYYYTAKYIKDVSVMGNWLCFTAEEAGSTVGIECLGRQSLNMQYSMDGGTTWKALGKNETIVLENVGDNVCLRGVNPEGLSFMQDRNVRMVSFQLHGLVAASGSLMSLIDGEGKSTVIPNEYCFERLFSDCSSLTKAPELPATVLTESCYSDLFYGCDNLREAPALPATTLARSCYDFMFGGCVSLEEAPALPADSLAPDCYLGMFAYCDNLKTPPSLPATKLANGCYVRMFQGCASLTEAPALPALDLGDWCYEYMFAECSNLTEAPALPATTLTPYCYTGMFSECTSLVRAPELPATQLVRSCYDQMFQGCASLNYIKVGVLSLDTDSMYIYDTDEWTTEGATIMWANGVDGPGTFIFPCGSTYDKHGSSQVPTNFVIKGLTVTVDSALSACDSITLGGAVYFESGVWNDTLRSVDGCDSIIAYHLTIHKGSVVDTTITAEGSYTWKDTTYTESASWSDTLQTAFGCDSIVIYHLEIQTIELTPVVVDKNLSACDSFLFKGITYREDASWSDTLQTASGADSIVTYHLTLHKGAIMDTTITAEGSYTWEDITYTESASWSDTLQTAFGCDSIVIYHLEIQTIEPTLVVVERNLSACDSFLFKGITYREDASWSDTLQTASGADSIVIYHLTIHKGAIIDTTITAEGSYIWKGTTYTEDASWSDTLQTILGCDSIVRYSLTVNKEKPTLQLTVRDELYLVLPGGSETVSYELTGSEGSKFEVRYNDQTLCSGDVANDSTVSLTCPSSLEPGAYTATLEMCDGEGNCAEKEFTFNVMLPDNKQKSYYVKTWNDVVICRNGEEQFQAFQWYKGRKKCENATLQYFNDVNLLNGKYMVYVTDKAGKSYFIEPYDFAPVEATYAITAEPNVVARNADFTMKVSGVAEEELKNARIVVYHANGVIESVIAEVEPERVMRLKSGEYVIVLTVSDGKNANCKVLVK